jgi:predicted acetyltransferase
MALKLEWVGETAYDRVALARHRCYSGMAGNLDKYREAMQFDTRQKPGDFLLASRDGIDVGTTTALSLHLWIRGARVPCQGVAYVGTTKTHRRGGSNDERGIASQLMSATIEKARERGEYLSALMPFRASFYEHFGYGNAEQRVEWNVPLSILPRGDFAGFRFVEDSDDARIIELRSREAAAGQCDIETTPAALASFKRSWPNGQTFVDQPTPGGPIESCVHLLEERGGAQASAVVDDWAAATPDAMLRLFHFLASLKDQYTFARITLPADLPLNRLLKETQVPHRQVDHPVATQRPYTRMQIRVLDHVKLLGAMTLQSARRGSCTVAIKENEGTVTRLRLDVADRKITATRTNSECDVEMTDVLWASIVSGDLRASVAHRWGTIRSVSASAIDLLEAFSEGPLPWCQEYF